MWYNRSEIAGYIDLLRAAHDDTGDTAESWQHLENYLRPAERWPQLRLPAHSTAAGLTKSVSPLARR